MSVIVETDGNIQKITFNRPEKKNALTIEMYSIIRKALADAANNDEITITVFTGTGEYFSSGNDFSGSFGSGDEDMESIIREKTNHVSLFVKSLIDHPKLLIAVVNGPAIGISVTMLGLFDLIYASEKTTFQTPFTSLGICAEGCSTYTFPKILGKSLAAKMLYFNHKMSTQEAKDCGFVTRIYKDISLVYQEIEKISKLPCKSLMTTKKMIRMHDYPFLQLANLTEVENLVQLFQSDEFMNAIMKMMLNKKSKL